MKKLPMILAAGCLALLGISDVTMAQGDDSAVIATMEGSVESIDLEKNTLIVADFNYSVPKSVPVIRNGTTGIGLDHVHIGDRVVLHMPPGQHWQLPMPVAEIEVKR